MSIFFAAMGAVLSTLTGSAVLAVPTVPAKMAQTEKFATTLPDDPALTSRRPDRALFRAHRQLPEAYGDCADGGDNYFAVDTPPLTPRTLRSNLGAVRTNR